LILGIHTMSIWFGLKTGCDTLAHRPCRRRAGAHPLELNQLHGEHEELSMHPVDDGPTLEDRRTELPLTL
jgi:hypothetical protein